MVDRSQWRGGSVVRFFCEAVCYRFPGVGTSIEVASTTRVAEKYEYNAWLWWIPICLIEIIEFPYGP